MPDMYWWGGESNSLLTLKQVGKCFVYVHFKANKDEELSKIN